MGKWTGWPTTVVEEELREELKAHGFSDFRPFNILYIAMGKIRDLEKVQLPETVDGTYFFPKQKYVEYLGEELGIESTRFYNNEIFEMLVCGEEVQCRAALRVLEDWRIYNALQLKAQHRFGDVPDRLPKGIPMIGDLETED